LQNKLFYTLLQANMTPITQRQLMKYHKVCSKSKGRT